MTEEVKNIKMMTQEEVDKKFDKAKVRFESYYKFSFSYVGRWRGFTILCSEGGNSDDIYRHSVSTAPQDFEEVGRWVSVTIKDKNGNEVFNHYDYY